MPRYGVCLSLPPRNPASTAARSCARLAAVAMGCALWTLGQLPFSAVRAAVFDPGPSGDLALELFENRSQAQLIGVLERFPLTPRPTPRAQRLARAISDSSDPMGRLYRAIALGRLDEARGLLSEARRRAAAPAAELDFAEAEIASFAGRQAEAIGAWQRALSTEAVEPMLQAALATSLSIADPRTVGAEELDAALQRLGEAPGVPLNRQLAIRLKLNFARLLDGRYADLDRALSDYLETRRQCSDCPWDRRLPNIQRLLAAVRMAQDRPAEAELLYKQALEWVEIAPPRERGDYPETELQQDLARLYSVQGRLAEAEQALRESGVAFEDGLPASVEGLPYLRDYARAELAEQRLDAAAKAIERAESLIEAAELPDYPWRVDFLGGRTALSLARGALTRAEIEQRRALALAQRALGADDPRLGTELVELAGVYLWQGRLEEAIEGMAEAVQLERDWPRRDPRAEARLLFRMGGLYLQLGAAPQSVDIFDLLQERSAEPTYGSAPTTEATGNGAGEDPNGAPRIVFDRRGAFLELGIAERTAAVYEALIELDRTYPNTIDPSLVAASQLILGNLYANQTRYADARPLLASGIQAWQQETGPNDTRTIRALSLLGFVNWKLDRLSESERAYARAAALLAASAASAGPDANPELEAQVKLGLGRVYGEQGRQALALEQLEQGLRLARHHFGEEHPLVAEIRGRYLSTQRRPNRDAGSAPTPPADDDAAAAQTQ